MWSAVMYCIDKCRQVQPYSLVVNAVDRVAIPGVGARWVHTIQRHVWQVHRCLCACVPTMVNGTGGVVIWSGHLLWWLYGQCTVHLSSGRTHTSRLNLDDTEPTFVDQSTKPHVGSDVMQT